MTAILNTITDLGVSTMTAITATLIATGVCGWLSRRRKGAAYPFHSSCRLCGDILPDSKIMEHEQPEPDTSVAAISYFTREQIASMRQSEYTKHRDAILAAESAGRII